MTEISNAYSTDIRKVSQKAEKQLKMKNTEKKHFVQPLVFKEYFPANTGLINCCFIHQEVPRLIITYLVLFLRGFNFCNAVQIY